MHAFSPKPAMIIVVLIYLAFMAIFGILISKRENQKSMKEFALAGKGLGSFVLIGTFISSWLGGGTITGSVNSLAYNFGIWPAVTYSFASLCGIVILYFLGPIVRKREKMTVAALLEDSYGKEARVISAIIIALASFSIVSFQFRGMGIVLNATTGISINTATFIGCAIIIILAVSGGMKTVALTDAVSAVIMLVCLLIAIPFIFTTIGGWEFIAATTKTELPLGLTFTGGWTWKDYLVNYLPAFLLTLSDQNLYQRMAAARDDKNVKIGMIGWGIGMVVVCPVIALLGYTGRMYFGTMIDASQSMIATSTLCPWVVGGLMMAAATSFIITTGDSYLLSGATNISTDVYHHFKKNASDRELLNVTRLSIVIFGVLSLGILRLFPSILAIQYWTYTIVGAGIAPSLLACVICPGKVTKWGGLSSMAGGTLLTIFWEMSGMPFGIATVLVAFPVSLILLIVVSAVTHKK